MDDAQRDEAITEPLPETLSAQAYGRVDDWQSATGKQPPAGRRARLASIFACSEFVAAQCIREPALVDDIDNPADIAAELKHNLGDATLDESEFSSRLRRLRNRAMARIAWRDLSGAGLEQTNADITELAEACIQAALGQAHRQVGRRHGAVRDQDGVPQELVVIGMGKLGGSDLNFSSDIDLVFLYPESGDSDGKRALPGDRYFARVAQDFIRLLNEPTSDGFVFRVDARLRPFGSTGALALSFEAFETYLQQHGREWERYAYIKARPLTGHESHRRQFLELVRPFVYRRYLDFGVLESLREMHALVSADVAGRHRRDDIKLGPGGIREIEFIVQSFQLLRGGADPALRDPSLVAVLPRLARRWLDRDVVDELLHAYRFLRRLENRLQAWRDQQVHRLPADEAGQTRVAYAMGYGSRREFYPALEQVRATVTRHFESVVPVAPADGQADVLRAMWVADPGAASAAAELADLGFGNPAGVQQQLKVLHDSGQYRRLDRRGRRRLDGLVPRMLRLAAQHDNADEVVARLLGIVTAVGGRSAYFALLNENPAVLDRLTRLCAASPWLARRVAQHPILLDELIDPRIFETPPDRDDLADDLSQRFSGVSGDDLERQMEALRMFQQASVFRVAVSDMSGVLPLMKVSDRLTDIAELVLEKTVELAGAEMQRRFGRPRCGDNGRVAGFAIAGYGKLGGLELGYASDLDLVFLHDSAGGVEQSDGEKTLDNVRYFARLGRRILHMLSTTTATGALYEVDMRLRPSGKGGPLVSSVSAFGQYQNESAWTWEHQALLRARAVAGAPAVREAFETVRRAVLVKQRDPDKLREDVLSMRQRMRRELSGGGPGEFDLKRDPGGLIDIEFMVQYRVLAGAAAHPALVRWSDNIRQLESLAAAGILDEALAAEMTDIYRRYRQRAHRLALADRPARIDDAEFRDEREFVRGRWAALFGE